MNDTLHDIVIVGSGPSGVMCAQTLVEAGKNVLMLDAGFTSNENTFNSGNFTAIRQTKSEQYKIWLGENFESTKPVTRGSIGQLTPGRMHIVKDSDKLLPIVSENFFPVQSLAHEGLGAAWGLGCYSFSDAELKRAGLPVGEMRKAYQVVADRIGISHTNNDVTRFVAEQVRHLQASIEVDDNAHEILRIYNRKKAYVNQQGFFVGIPALALLTSGKDERAATAYNNMDFYNNQGESAYRPSITLNSLSRYHNFKYLPGVLVKSFTEEDGIVTISSIEIKTNNHILLNTKKLVLAANAPGTARIVLRSFSRYDHAIPILCNPYTMIACIQPSQIFRSPSDKRTSTAQLSIFYEGRNHEEETTMASVYSYSSLMLFRAIRDLKLSYGDALSLFRRVQHALVIAGLHFPDFASPQKNLKLVVDEQNYCGDILHADYRSLPAEIHNRRHIQARFSKILKQLGCLPVKTFETAAGASAHYAGTLPFANDGSALTTFPGGQLAGTNNVFVADGSGFRYLPAKGLTFTLMANAHITALRILQHE